MCVGRIRTISLIVIDFVFIVCVFVVFVSVCWVFSCGVGQCVYVMFVLWMSCRYIASSFVFDVRTVCSAIGLISVA